MDIKQLRYFLCVLEAKSVTKAAEVLHVAQPAVGMQIRNLEEELGVKLLVRHSRGVTPTEAGTELAKHAESLLRDFERARQDVMNIGGEPRGRVSVGMTEAVMHALAADLLKACRRKFPAVLLDFSEGMSDRLSEWITEDRLDVALTYHPPDDSGLVREILAIESLCFAVPAKHAVAGVSEITLREALKYDLILTSQMSFFRVQVEQAANMASLALNIVCEADSPAMIKEFVRSGMGCSVVPFSGVRPEVENGSIFAPRIVDPEVQRTLYLSYTKKRENSKVLRAVCGEIRNIVRELIEFGDIRWTAPSGKGSVSPPD